MPYCDRVQCLTCLRAGKVSVYEGKTGKNGFCRGIQYLDAIHFEDIKNAIWKHCKLEHNSIKAEFQMQIFQSFPGCLEKQVNEAVSIAMFKGDMILNS